MKTETLFKAAVIAIFCCVLVNACKNETTSPPQPHTPSAQTGEISPSNFAVPVLKLSREKLQYLVDQQNGKKFWFRFVITSPASPFKSLNLSVHLGKTNEEVPTNYRVLEIMGEDSLQTSDSLYLGTLRTYAKKNRNSNEFENFHAAVKKMLRPSSNFSYLKLRPEIKGKALTYTITAHDSNNNLIDLKNDDKISFFLFPLNQLHPSPPARPDEDQ